MKFLVVCGLLAYCLVPSTAQFNPMGDCIDIAQTSWCENGKDFGTCSSNRSTECRLTCGVCQVTTDPPITIAPTQTTTVTPKPVPSCLACATLDGYSIGSETLCKGIRVDGSCETDTKPDCCIPECPYGEGFFSPPNSRQCFKYFEEKATWNVSKATCEAEKQGLVLAHPFEAVSLRSYLMQRFGWSVVWLNGRGNGTVMIWQDNKAIITNDSPLMYNGSYTTSDCLAQAGTDAFWKKSPTAPFFTNSCTKTAAVLCELKIEYPSGVTVI